MKGLKLFISAVAALALLAMPAGALAKRGDRDRDRMPDKWERRHHLNPHANDARRDPDHDGLRNVSEFRRGTDPHDADTDDDGVRDDDEVSGTVQSFDGTTLVIKLAGDNTGTVSGTVTSTTRIECEHADDDTATPTATASHDGESGGGDDNSGPGSTNSGDDDREGDDDQPAPQSCAIAVGDIVHEAEFVTTDNGNSFTEVELIK